ncbi:hypothetical protein [Ramlibacter sp. Leaf400]|uniref:hypothetical protein n=1 Tax=Ramlibacter sp. Leaf400 TaxID=1736365 RepID=UPI0006F518B0|nr:hypothetical protein [Ramlibacter sp. Leaf400]KQT10484.1 hypothetical protein ASG30_11685 [Ramlibacter sp. Leaf400]
MNHRFFTIAFCIGLLALGWVGWSFVGTSWLALVMTAVIAAVYLVGAFELRQFRATTTGLRGALEGLKEPPAALADWLDRVPAALRPVVRSRIEGERSGLPGPALTPYLVGLLVMLGMLGTFLGMVVTFKGAVFALQGSTDLQAIRSALAEPIRGLGLSFGTSVAGVAASAMLGLMSAIGRRERLEVGRLLDTRIASVLQPFSLAHQRQETVRALQAQAHSLPEVVTALHAVMDRIERRSEQLDAQLLERQAQLQRDVTLAYSALARSVGDSLQQTLAANAKSTGETVKPIVEQAMTHVVAESQRLHQRLGEVAQDQVDALTQRFTAAEQQRLEAWTGALEQRANQVTDRAGAQSRQALEQVSRLLDQSQQLVAARAEAEARWLQEHGERMDKLAVLWRTELGALRTEESQRGDAAVQRLDQVTELWRTELGALRNEESQRGEAAVQRIDRAAELWRSELGALRQEEGQRGDAAVQRLSELQAAVAQHLATLGAALEAPITRLLNTAAEVPQAAAGVIGQLRQEMSRVAERDNLALQERTVLLERLTALVQSLEQAAGEQRAAVEGMVGSATSVLAQAQERFAKTMETQAGQAAEMAAHVSGSAVEMASVAESFGESVRHFQASHDKLSDTLQRVETSLTRSTARSDEQLAYYVAQAREVIDLSIASQQGLVESLRQLQGKARSAPVAESVA